MSATDELRRMLDERGVEHYDGTECTLWGYEDYNEFTGIYRFSADETSDGHMQVRLWYVTPEQAIAATLGSGTCRFKTVIDQDPSRRHRGNICECDGCGYRCARGFIEDERFKYCPNCGRRVVEVDS